MNRESLDRDGVGLHSGLHAGHVQGALLIISNIYLYAPCVLMKERSTTMCVIEIVKSLGRREASAARTLRGKSIGARANNPANHTIVACEPFRNFYRTKPMGDLSTISMTAWNTNAVRRSVVGSMNFLQNEANAGFRNRRKARENNASFFKFKANG